MEKEKVFVIMPLKMNSLKYTKCLIRSHSLTLQVNPVMPVCHTLFKYSPAISTVISPIVFRSGCFAASHFRNEPTTQDLLTPSESLS